MIQEWKNLFLQELQRLHDKNELSKTIGPDYYEPGMMEYPAQYDGVVDPQTGDVRMRFEVRGTAYDGRTEQIEKVHTGDMIQIIREPENSFNSNNFTFLTAKDHNVGNMPAELCNVIAPLYDSGCLTFSKCYVSFVEPISQRSRHAKKAVLFVEVQANISDAEILVADNEV